MSTNFQPGGMTQNVRMHSTSFVPNSIFSTSANITVGTLSANHINKTDLDFFRGLANPKPHNILRLMAEKHPEWNGVIYYNYEPMPDGYSVNFFYKHEGYTIYNEVDEPYEDYCFSSGKKIVSGNYIDELIVETAIKAGEEDIDNMLHDTHPDGLWAVKK